MVYKLMIQLVCGGLKGQVGLLKTYVITSAFEWFFPKSNYQKTSNKRSNQYQNYDDNVLCGVCWCINSL